MLQFDVDTWYEPTNDQFSFSKDVSLTGKPISLTLEVSEYCNLSCRYCLSDSGSAKKSEEVPSEVIEKLVDLAPFKVIFAGGEPFLLPNIEELITSLNSAGCPIYVATNGTYVPRDIIGYVDNFDVHVDGTVQEVYCKSMGKNLLGKVKRNIEMLVSAGAQVRVNCVVNRNNYENAFTLPEFCQDLGIDKLEMIRTLPMGRARLIDLSVSEQEMSALREACNNEYPSMNIHFMYANDKKTKDQWFPNYPVFNGNGQLLSLPDHVPRDITLFDSAVQEVFDQYKLFLRKSPRTEIRE